MNFDQIIEDYTKDLLRLAYFYTNDMQVAETIVEDVFIQFYHLKKKKEENLKKYLVQLTIQNCKSTLKGWRFRKAQFKEKLLTDPSSKKVFLVEVDEDKRVKETIFKIKLPQREAFILYHYFDFSTREISELLKTPINNVKANLQEAQKQIKLLLENEWEVLLYEAY